MLDNQKLAALDIAANKKNRVIAAQYASKMSPAFSAFFSVNVSVTRGRIKSIPVAVFIDSTRHF